MFLNNMTKTKQQKFTGSLRQSQTNTFSDGLNMDLHPLSTPNTVMTDCINGTMITYNDNEFVLQNERGNSIIPDAHLSEGFIPVAMKEYNGILYIVSYNPKDKKTEIGTYPSPATTTEMSGIEYKGTISNNTISKYTEYNQEINYYDYNLLVSNYDRYLLNTTPINDLLTLEHFIMDDQGTTKKIQLRENETHRFSHAGIGVLGYRYRPYYLTSVNVSIVPVQNGNSAKLICTSISDDSELINGKYEDLDFGYKIRLYLVSNKLEKVEYIPNEGGFTSNYTSFYKDWVHTYNIENNHNISLDILNDFTIGDNQYVYDDNLEAIVSGDKIFNMFEIRVQPFMKSGEHIIYFDHLDSVLTVNPSKLLFPESHFIKFNYKKVNSDDANETFDITVTTVIDSSKYHRISINKLSSEDIGEASYKLYKIDNNGNLIGISITPSFVLTQSPIYDVVTDSTNMGKNDLLLSVDEFGEGEYHFKLNKTTDIIPVKYGKNEQCNNLPKQDSAAHVQYIKENDTTYNVVLFDAKMNKLSETNVFSSNPEACPSEIIDERFDGQYIYYTIDNLTVDRNEIYLLELTYPIRHNFSWKNNKASFIVVTADKMFEYTDVDRMDQIQLKDWFDYTCTNTAIAEDITYSANQSKYKNNIINVTSILNCDSEASARILANQQFIKFNQLYDFVEDCEIPAINQEINVKINLQKSEDCPFTCALDIDNTQIQTMYINEGSIKHSFTKTLKLQPEVSEYRQITERKYLYDIFKNTSWKMNDIISGEAYGWNGGQNTITSTAIKLVKPNYTCQTGHSWADPNNIDWINHSNNIFTEKYLGCNRMNGGCLLAGLRTVIMHTIKDGDGLFGGSLQIMKEYGMSSGLSYGKIKRGDANYHKHVNYNKSTNKFWIHGKIRNVNNYVLAGIDALIDDETSEKVYDAILKHSYLLENVNKLVYQYKYEPNVQTIENTDPIHITGKMYPIQCNIKYTDNNLYNVQSWNNLNTTLLSNINVEEKFTHNFVDMSLCETFLLALGELITENPISLQHLQESSPNPNKIYFDSGKMYSEDLQISDINTSIPNNLYFDPTNGILYIELQSNNIASFNYERTCISPLNWNYHLDFSEFWDISVDDIDKLNTYHSPLFYKTTTYGE